MNSIKTLATVALLAATGIGLYIKINSAPQPAPPEAAPLEWEAPSVDLGSLGSPVDAVLPPLTEAQPGGGMAPSFDAAQAGSAAPPFDGTSVGGAAPPFDPAAAGGAAPAFDPAAVAPPADLSATAVPFPHGGEAPRYGAAATGGDSLAGGSVSADPFVQQTSAAAAASFPSAGSYDDAWKEAQGLLQQGQLDAAHRLLSNWYGDASLTPVMRDQLVELLSQLAGTLIYSTEHHLEPAYTVKSGETLADIAKLYNVSPQLLAKINGIADPARLQPGTQLKVVRGPFTALVSLSQRELTLALEGRYAGRFPIAIGQEWQPTEGEFEVKTKYTNPTYFGRNQTIDAENPDNPLGEHWVGLISKDGAYSGPLGIHGTNDPASLHSTDSRGYLRLAPQDAEDIFDILTVGSQVVIRQ